MSKLVSVAVVVSLGCLGLLIYVQLDAPVARVKVSGQLDGAESQQIRRAVRQTVDGGLLSADLDKLRSSILDLGWPRAVTIRRSWPDSLEIAVEKPTVVARWNDAYLSSDGRIVQLPGTRRNLPIFDCSLSEPRFSMEVFHRLSEASALHGLVIETLEENELGEWSLTFEQGLALTLGAENLTERLDRFLIVYQQHLENRLAEIAQVDARYDNGVAVSWRAPDRSVALVASTRARDLNMEQL